jgi:uncharacterized membrane protein YwzB
MTTAIAVVLVTQLLVLVLVLWALQRARRPR